MIRFIRRNTVAFIALLIALGGTAYAANTVRSIDIVDGTIKTQDLANGAVTPTKTKNVVTLNSTNFQKTAACVQPQIWFACTPIPVYVPAGRQWRVTVISTVNAEPTGTQSTTALYCAAKSGPTCINGGPVYATFGAHVVTSATDTATVIVGPGSYTFSTAVKFPVTVVDAATMHTTTTVIITDLGKS